MVSDDLVDTDAALLDGRQLRNRRIELYDLLVPDQSVLKLVKRKVLRHFLQIVHRGPVAVIYFLSMNTLSFVLQRTPFFVQLIADGNFLINAIVVLDFDCLHVLPPSRFISGCGRTT